MANKRKSVNGKTKKSFRGLAGKLAGRIGRTRQHVWAVWAYKCQFSLFKLSCFLLAPSRLDTCVQLPIAIQVQVSVLTF